MNLIAHMHPWESSYFLSGHFRLVGQSKMARGTGLIEQAKKNAGLLWLTFIPRVLLSKETLKSCTSTSGVTVFNSSQRIYGARTRDSSTLSPCDTEISNLRWSLN